MLSFLVLLHVYKKTVISLFELHTVLMKCSILYRIISIVNPDLEFQKFPTITCPGFFLQKFWPRQRRGGNFLQDENETG